MSYNFVILVNICAIFVVKMVKKIHFYSLITWLCREICAHQFMFSCILGMVVKLSIRFFPSGVIIFWMGISCIQATALTEFFPGPCVVPYYRFIWPLCFATVCWKLNVTHWNGLQWLTFNTKVCQNLSTVSGVWMEKGTRTHAHTHTHTQHGNNIIIVLFRFREESWLNTAVLLVASNRCEAVTLKEEQRMGIFEKR